MLTRATCPTCAAPLAGRGRCRSAAHAAFGPRRVGDVWRSRSFGHGYRVLALDAGDDDRAWTITIALLDERGAADDRYPARVTHYTPWDARRDGREWALVERASG